MGFAVGTHGEGVVAQEPGDPQAFTQSKGTCICVYIVSARVNNLLLVPVCEVCMVTISNTCSIRD